jgi:ribosomal protein L40E
VSLECDHVGAICDLLESKLASAPAATARRLLRPQLRWVERQLGSGGGEELAHRLGVVALVEACRDEHLASLDADDGLAALSVDWRDVVVRACERALADADPRTCPRCGARLRRTRAARCRRCGLSDPILRKRSASS